MISVSINKPDFGELKVKDSDGYVVYNNKQFRYIDYLNDLGPDTYLIHLRIASRNYYEILYLTELNIELAIEMDAEII